jgi:DNA-binding IclR family transcriptional regulator
MGEYDEMPGLNVTLQQAQRLWHLDEATCVQILTVLVEQRFLTRTSRRTYVRTE